jgi:hypothetical protein
VRRPKIVPTISSIIQNDGSDRKLMDLDIFYTALATVAATLLGLLFIAIQQNAERLHDPHSRWRALAVSTFYSYTVILVVALFTFIPIMRTPTLWVACLIGIWRQVGA